MKVVIAIDSLKGSLSSIEAGNAVKEGILKACKYADVVVKPLADGGEGTTEALIKGMNGKEEFITVTGPLGEKVKSKYAILEQSNTAIIEMAQAAGITLLEKEKRNPLNTTSYGVGEMIKDSIKKGCRNFIIGIGGSATNDGGIGMLQALGFEFLDKNKKSIGFGGKFLEEIKYINIENKLKELDECNFKIACDVENPLCGKNGASYIYGPQKGASESMVERLDKGMKNYSEVVKNSLGKDCADKKGAGAAGGIGYAFLSFLNAELKPGIDIVINETKLEDEIKDADFVITGEGRLDFQTAMGKAPIGVAKIAKKYNCTVIALAGSITDDASECNKKGIDAYFDIITEIVTLDEAMQRQTALKNLKNVTVQIFNLINKLKN